MYFDSGSLRTELANTQMEPARLTVCANLSPRRAAHLDRYPKGAGAMQVIVVVRTQPYSLGGGRFFRGCGRN